MTHLNVNLANAPYRAMLGVGGIGSGTFFSVNGNHTLGREESRSGHFLDRRDYCKLHIISHYVATLLGPAFDTIPLGMVGDDVEGQRLVEEMSAAGMDMRFVSVLPATRTLYSFCVVYPDGAGCNLTTDNSASSQVNPATVLEAEPEFARFGGAGIALAAPEVPLAARRTLLELAERYSLLRVASFAAEEVAPAIKDGLIARADLLALNLDEAAAAAGLSPENNSPERVAVAAINGLSAHKTELFVAVTAGRHGSWCFDGSDLRHEPALAVTAVSTAGAGDAFLAGLICGCVAGLALPGKQQLATLVAGQSVTSPHTINKRVNRQTLYELVGRLGSQVEDEVLALLD